MIIDAHVHMSYLRSDIHLKEMTEACKRLSIDSIRVSKAGDWSLCPSLPVWVDGNRDVMEAVESHTNIVRGYAYVSPCYEEEALTELTTYMKNSGMIGLKLWMACKCNDPGSTH